MHHTPQYLTRQWAYMVQLHHPTPPWETLRRCKCGEPLIDGECARVHAIRTQLEATQCGSWSWVLTLLTWVSLLLVGRKLSAGWAIGLGAQGLWMVYGVQSHQYGFLVAAGLASVIYARNWWSWRRGPVGCACRGQEAAVEA